jgi:tetratricopeptide (TPR) repeat protein
MRDYEYDRDGATREYQRALALNPGYASAHHWYAMHLVDLGRFEEALGELKRAQELDPLSLMIGVNLGTIHEYWRRYDVAIEECRKVLSLDPNYGMARLKLGALYVGVGKHAEALPELEAGVRLQGGDAYAKAELAWGYAVSGRRAEARRLLGEMEETARTRHVSRADLAWVHVGLGDLDRTFEELNRAVDEREPLRWMTVDPHWDPLRKDPRFGALLRRIKLGE